MGVSAGDGFPDVNVTASFNEAYNGPSGAADDSGFLPSLGLNFYDRGSNPAWVLQLLMGYAMVPIG